MAGAPERESPIPDGTEAVVDADFHLRERQEDFLPYIEDPFHAMLIEERRKSDTEYDAGYIGDFYPSAGLFVSAAVSGKIDNPAIRTREGVLEGMGMLDIDRTIVTPTQNLYLGGIHHDDLAAALANAYNSWVLDEIFDPGEGIYGPAIVAPQKPARAAEEIDDRADEPSVVGAFVPSGGIHPLLGNEFYHPIFEAAEDNGLPVMFHNASGTQMLSFPLQYHATNRYLSNHAHTHAMLHMSHLTDMITRGVPVRFPDLEFVFQEAGLGWVPYMTRRLDNEYSEKRDDAPMLEQPPSEYVRDRFYFTSQPVEGADDPDYVTSVVRLIGPESVLFSSDYPHHDFDHPHAAFRALAREFDEETLRGIYGETALSVFDF